MHQKVRNLYYQGPVSDHFDGSVFFNPGGVEPGTFRDLLKWQFGGGRQVWPKDVPSPFTPVKPEARVGGARLKVTMIGHASVLIQTSDLNILIDPVWSARTSPVTFAGPKRHNLPGIAFEDLPQIDLVIVTHNHYDHLDLATLKRLQQAHHAPILTPLGNDAIIRKAIPQAKVLTCDWGDHIPFEHHVSVDCEPCHHWSARGSFDRRMALWAAFVINTPSGKIYHIGDTGFHDGIDYKAAAHKHGGFRLAILPIGAYEPRWFMQGQHQNPEEAVQGMMLCKAEQALGHHWGTFQLTDEGVHQPVDALHAALEKAGIDRTRFRAMHPGEEFEI
ncbi:MAG: hypothetical protein RIR97_606 [Pseudomonadota bacterium]